MRYEETEQGLIQVQLGYLSDHLQWPFEIGPMEKNQEDRWIVPLFTPANLPSNISSEQFTTELQELAQRLESEHQLQVQFVMPQQ